MTNGEKFVTAQERAEAMDKWCAKKWCEDCVLREYGIKSSDCAFHWLDLEAEEEKPLPCPFCGNDKLTIEKDDYGSQVHCLYCGYRAIKCGKNVDPIAAHNSVAKAVKESESASDAKGEK